MGEVTRTSSSTDEPDQWSGGTVPAPLAQPHRDTKAVSARVEAQHHADDQIGYAMHQIAAGAELIGKHLAKATERATDELDYAAMAETVGWLQAIRRTMGEAEAYVARELGRLDGTPDMIVLADGRHAEVLKGKDRKEWRHDDWKRDVRAKLVKAAEAELGSLELFTDQGEPRDVGELLHDAMTAAQAVHGSAAPKVTALKPLGLAADDYCSSFPGPYAVKISAPTDTTTNQEN